jgi:predicted transcriptional regulator
MSKGVTVLEHKTRRMIYYHILAHPGVSFNILRSVFGLNESTLRYHLSYLEKKEQIQFGVRKGRRRYYPHSAKNIVVRKTREELSAHELNPRQDLIVGMIRRYPGITQKELLHKTGLKRLTLTKNLNKLMDLYIIRRIYDHNKVRYEYIKNDQLQFEMLKQLVIKLLRKEIDEATFLELKRKLE